MDVSIIYVNWNCADEIQESLVSVRHWTQNMQYEVIVVDNDSPEGSGGLEMDSGIHLIRNPENRGFGAGCNLGARQASGRYFLFLNPDTRFLNDVLSELKTFLDSHPEVAASGPLTMDSNDNVLFEAGRSLPTLFGEFLQHSTLAFRFPSSTWAARPLLSDWDHLSTREVETILGACMLIRSELFQALGGFDENFFLYCEELDLCRRIRESGFQVWYVHKARLLHKERQSTMKLFGSLDRIVLENMRSQHYYFKKHSGAFTAFVWRHMIAATYFVRYLISRQKLHLDYSKWALAA